MQTRDFHVGHVKGELTVNMWAPPLLEQSLKTHP